MVVGLWLLGLIGYYSFNRPQEPIPERRWTEQLKMTHGYYGTHAENEQLVRLFYWLPPFMLMEAPWIFKKVLQKKNEP
jgi:hypothetical protein